MLGYLEVRSALARARFKDNPRRLTPSGYDRALRNFEADWLNYVRAPVTNDLIQLAGNLTSRYYLRAYDALHLATAMALVELVSDSVLVSTWDTDLAAAAQAEGLSLAHEVTT
jgi:predicted nucleic acid-binding protein